MLSKEQAIQAMIHARHEHCTALSVNGAAAAAAFHCSTTFYFCWGQSEGIKLTTEHQHWLSHRQEKTSDCTPEGLLAQTQTPSSFCCVKMAPCCSTPALLYRQHPTQIQKPSEHLHCHRWSSCGAGAVQDGQQTSCGGTPPPAAGGHVPEWRRLMQMTDPLMQQPALPHPQHVRTLSLPACHLHMTVACSSSYPCLLTVACNCC